MRRVGRALRADWRRSCLAALSGVVLTLAFPPFGYWQLSVVSAAALSLLTRGRRAGQAAWTGFAFALPFFLWLLEWLHAVGWDAVVGLSLIEACFFVPMGAGLALTSRLPGWPLWGACLWVTQEWARDRVPFGGFPWGRLAFANTGSPFTGLAAVGGAPLVTFAVALSAGLLAAAVVAGRRLWSEPAARRRAGAVLGVCVVLAALVLGAGRTVPSQTTPDGTLRVALVQGNVARPGMHFLGRPMEILDNHIAATMKLAADIKAGRVAKPQLVIWPENSSDIDPFQYPQAYAAIDSTVRAVGVPVLVGALVDGPDPEHVQNEGILWDPVTGPGASYTKQHPVPFGEYVPFRKELTPLIPQLKEIPRDFYPGDHDGVMRMGPATLGDVICFEVAYDGIVRDTVNGGAHAIVVQTNNATYGRSGQPAQQLAMYRLRAVEHGRSVVAAATSGISTFVAPDGTVKARTQEFTRAVLNVNVPLRSGSTVADRVGAAPEWLLAMVGLLSCAAAIRFGRRGRTETKGKQ
ncbi:apolipoprotein N-acyltransferase [Streptomyces sp. SL13]|uniref:Apolipoprotein N-acyltransferase n=1 Tax=Streptantibioticus silvisoli TaxID=2705255 RepID=A0AA90HAD0_9ACTN|nr:apolipoprotein N-acyltransferase [Streptantibioticus silvisoli]MDI5966106.1 apolipoprotein N-acyltransferase [Streptantibioticus silvisoli]MDI5971930.1 apolipoprotein N-acyltransferase [Streptantibioticus silvisoli]